MLNQKKGLSPVIATVLLIMLAIILAIIVLIWARSFIGEKVTKDLGAGPEPIETFCEDIQFVVDASYDGSKLSLTAQNNGDVPIYGFEIRKKSSFSVKKIADVTFDQATLLSGETKDTDPVEPTSEPGDSVLVVPVLLGESESGKKYYTCDDNYGLEVEVY